MNKTVQISIVIVNYNVKDMLLRCLNSIYSKYNNSLLIETIVIDNDSKDGSVEAVINNFPQVIVIENKFNAGFSAANNQGMRIAKGKYVFLLNPDTEIIDDALNKLITYLENSSTCAIIGPQLLNTDSTIQISTWKNHSPLSFILETLFLNKLFNLLDFPLEKLKTTFESETLSGAALFFRKDLINKIGMLDPNLFWMEDIDFCIRSKQYGSIIYFHEAQVFHHSGQSQKKNYNVAIANQLLSKLKYYKKHSFFINVWITDIFCFVFIITRWCIFTILSPFKEIYKLKRNAYSYTLHRYFNYLFLNNKSIT